MKMADRRVLSIQPESGFYHKRAIKSIDKEDFPAALRHLRKAIAMEPENLTYRMDLANTYARMGLYERSNLEIQLMLHKASMPAEALFGMGSNFMAMGDYDQAETMFKAYAHVEPEGEYIDQAEDGLSYIAECDYETDLDRELDELSMDGKAALDAGDLDHAIDCLETALQKDPEMTYVRNNLAVAYYCIGDMDRAWENLDIVLRESPLDVHGRCNESMFLLSEGRKDEAVEAVRKLRLDRIEEVDELFKYCLALADVDLDQELYQALKKIFLSSPYDPSMLYLFGVCQYNLGKPQESLRTFEKLAQTDPDSLLALYGARTAAAALRGEDAPKRLPYTFDFPQEMEREVDAELETLAHAAPEEAAKALQDPEVCARVRAALTGSDAQMNRAIRLLAKLGGPVAERMLRELLLSPTHNAYFKQKTLDALHTMNAPEPFYSLQDGKLVLVRSRNFPLDPKLPKPYLRVMRDVINRMAQRYGESQAVEFTAGIWAAYILYLDGHFPKIRNEKAWVLVLDGLYRERQGKSVDWRALADEAGTTLRTMQTRRAKLAEAEERVQAEEKEGEEEK
jgi:tetratricopeptide (TPR) repeat protein